MSSVSIHGIFGTHTEPVPSTWRTPMMGLGVPTIEARKSAIAGGLSEGGVGTWRLERGTCNTYLIDSAKLLEDEQ